MAENENSDRLEVGSIGKAHGVRGESLVRLSTDRQERVEPGSLLYTAEGRQLEVVSSRPSGSNWIVRFAGFEDRNAAETLRNTVLFADPIEDDAVVWVHELIGRRLREIDGTPRGVIVAVQENPASDLMVTDSGDLCPLTFYVDHTDDEVVVDTPSGLFDLGEAD